MTYHANQHSSGKKRHDSHEEAVLAIFLDNGFQEESSKNHPKLKQGKLLAAIKLEGEERQAAIAALVPDMASGTVIHQPAGSQSFPDFLFRDFDGVFVIIEAKSSGSNTPAWNDSLPRDGCVYVFSSGKSNQTTVWLGEDLIDDVAIAIIDELRATIDLAVKAANIKLSETHFGRSRGWFYYARPKFGQRGKAHIADPFVHPDRQMCEENTLAFVLNPQ